MTRMHLKEFRELFLMNKSEILYSIKEYIEHCKTESDEVEWSYEKQQNIINLCERFKNEIETIDLPSCLDNWWYYDFKFRNDSLDLMLLCCTDIDFDQNMELSSISSKEGFLVHRTKCKYLSVKDYANQYNVTTTTVRQWIRRGKLRAAKKTGNIWMIPEITERPKRCYKNASYYWQKKIDDIVQFPFLNRTNYIYIYQDDEIKSDFWVITGWPDDEIREKIKLDVKDREKLELVLISNPDIIAEENEAIYCPPKKIWVEKNDQKQRFINKSYKKQIDKEIVLTYGPVLVTKGIIYWGDMLLLNNYEEVNLNYITNIIPTISLVNRIEELRTETAKSSGIFDDYESAYYTLQELLFAENILNERYLNVMFFEGGNNMKIFISHATVDLYFARSLATDLSEAGYKVFLDDFSIELGENIVNKISYELDTSQILLPLVSCDFLESVFCNDEWTSFYMKFTKDINSMIIPIILDDSTIPHLLKPYKYWRCKNEYEYQNNLFKLLQSLKKFQSRTKTSH